MKLEQRIQAFSTLGGRLENISKTELEELFYRANSENKWFTEANISSALQGIAKFLRKDVLENWLSAYSVNDAGKRVGVIMAGNIPLAGFHDFLTILISGNAIDIRKSSQDSVLIDYIVKQLIEIEPGFKEKIRFVDKLNEAEAIIATGSDNTSRYFEYYFAKRPHIIRKNRSSAAVIKGDESQEELEKLADDIFLYFGLGCRNVSKVYLPVGFDPTKLYPAFEKYLKVAEHTKYGNNYDYNKAIFLLKALPFFDNGFLMLREDESLVSAISVLHYQFYPNEAVLAMLLAEQEEKLQIIVSSNGWYPHSIPFGKAQYPEVDDYADKVDTVEFLLGL